MKKRFISILTAIALILTGLGSSLPVSYAESGDVSAGAFTEQQVQGLKILSTQAESVKLIWDPLEGASVYEIFRSTSQEGSYKQVGTVKSEVFIDKGLTPGKKYYYKVRACRELEAEIMYSLFSDPASAVPVPAAPNIKKLSQGQTKITITWNKVSGADGYQIYRASKAKGAYEVIADISAKKGCKYTSTNLKSGKRYYYKVRAYAVSDGKKIYSSFSQPKSAKTLTKLEAQTGAFIKKAIKDSMTDERKNPHFRSGNRTCE